MLPVLIQRDRLDPDVLNLLDEEAAENHAPLESLSPQEARVAAADGVVVNGGALEPLASVRDIVIDGPGGPIPARVYTPNTHLQNRPAVVYFHGGGWVVCGLDTHDAPCHAIANRSGSVVIAVDYRLAPEHPFPAAVDDAYAAVTWVHNNAQMFGADMARVVVCGDSAGGNLSAVVSLLARDAGEHFIALQVLVYPVTNLASFDAGSYVEFAEGYRLTRPLMEWFRGHYIAHPDDAKSPLASPLFAENLAGLPAALVITAECDVLRDEGELYAERLRKAGVPVTLTRYPGMIHPFFSLAGRIRRTSDAYDEVAAAIRGL